ncbi:3522_t:CDS:2, partial [Cetraspora pellucida]
VVLAKTIGIARSTNIDKSCQAVNLHYYQEVPGLCENKMLLKIVHELSLMQM